MNAIVEVVTASVTVKADNVRVEWTRKPVDTVVPVVATSTLRIPSINGSSISAVAPDHTLIGGIALAAA